MTRAFRLFAALLLVAISLFWPAGTFAANQDFDAEGRSDILWRNTSTGQNAIWLMNGTTLSGGGLATTVADTGWSIAGTGDFDGDGRPDILWRHTNGNNAIWLMNGTTLANGGLIPTVTDMGWSIAGIGDFNGDGKADILWRHTSGQNAIWLMNGLTMIGGGLITSVADTAWQVKGVGDFDGDGKSDILWRHANGNNAIWLMNGLTLAGGGLIVTVADSGWSIAGVGDFNGDGKSDILWRHTNGNNSIWLMNGLTLASGALTTTVADSNWTVMGVGDFNADGKSDILWRHSGTGQNSIWLMNGTALAGGGLTTTVADNNWKIVRFFPAVNTHVTGPPPPQPVISSYLNFKAIGLTPQVLPSVASAGAHAYGDFSGNGRHDLFVARLTYTTSLPPSQATPSRFEFWRNQADGSYVLDTTLLASSNGCIHPRKALVADFNGDGRPDVFVACHGYDADPFPGERAKIVLSQPGGTYTIQDAAADIGFFHGASATDLNGDGFPDVVVTDRANGMPFVLLNQGNGTFVREARPRLPASVGGKLYFSAEFIDVDGDGKLDLLFGGHEWVSNSATVVLLNPGNNDFSAVQPIALPGVANEGVVLDFVVTGTTGNRAIWVLRTSGGDGTFYEGVAVQKVSWPGLASTVVFNQRSLRWTPLIIPATVNGQAVITSDDASVGLSLPQ